MLVTLRAQRIKKDLYEDEKKQDPTVATFYARLNKKREKSPPHCWVEQISLHCWSKCPWNWWKCLVLRRIIRKMGKRTKICKRWKQMQGKRMFELSVSQHFESLEVLRLPALSSTKNHFPIQENPELWESQLDQIATTIKCYVIHYGNSLQCRLLFRVRFM